MKQQLLLVTMFVTYVLLANVAHADQVCYVQSATAKILSSPSFSANTVAEASIGQKLSLKKREGSWAQVEYDGAEGYVSALLVSSHPPLERRRFIKSDDPKIERGVRRRASYFASAAAARGLTKEDRMRADVEGNVDYPALSRMEELSFSDAEVTRFMEGGKP